MRLLMARLGAEVREVGRFRGAELDRILWLGSLASQAWLRVPGSADSVGQAEGPRARWGARNQERGPGRAWHHCPTVGGGAPLVFRARLR